MERRVRSAGPRELAALALGIALAAPLAAQIPEEFQNLKVLPRDIEQRQLVDVMKSFCSALDVRCTHCHVGEEGAPLSELDFVSDDKYPKRAARVMMRMVDAINGTHLAELGEGRPELEVRCVTCHHGQEKPRSLEQVLAEAVTAGGIDEAVAKYRELREQYYGSATFDFSSRTLPRLASELAEQGQEAAAIAFLELNVELFPDSAMSYFLLGDLQAKSGAEAAAIESLVKALELEPRNPLLQRRLQQLKGGG